MRTTSAFALLLLVSGSLISPRATRATAAANARLKPSGSGVDSRVLVRWPNGNLRSDTSYRDSVYDGDVLTWYEGGQPYQRRHFVRGHEDGLQQAWTDKGALYVNYEVREGRRFGLLNSTPCVEVEGKPRPALPYYDSADFTPHWTPVNHRIAAFGLTKQDAAPISERSLDRRIHVASFIYTQCAAVCPILVAQLTRVQAAIQSMPNAVLVSYSVTPESDTPQALAAFGRERNIDPARWWLVTGSRSTIYELARTSYFADDDRVGSSGGFLHTEKLLLVDGDRHIRGIYNGTQPREIDLLIRDIGRLNAEMLHQ